MRRLAFAAIVVVTGLAAPVYAQQDSQKSLQNEADRGIKTQNSGASGFVGEQETPGAAARVPGSRSETGGVATAPSAQNSGTGIAGAPGNKNGPPAQGTTTGSASQNLSVQEQDTSNIKGLPGNKSGPPAKR
jgi:hypothetical protein